MNADTHKEHSQAPAKRAAFLKLVENYVTRHPKWTSAEGALLVNGVMPPPKGCTNIPELKDGLRQLDDPALPATQSQLNGAKSVFQDYLDHVEDGDLPPGDEVLAVDFLKWCHDSDQAPWNVTKLPEFLRYLFFPGSPEHPFTLSVADELAALKIMAAASDALGERPDLQENVPAGPRIIQNRTVVSKRVNELDPSIEKAIAAVKTDKTGPVWQELRNMALNGERPFTGEIRQVLDTESGKNVDAFVYATNVERKDGRRTAHLTYDALDSRLRRGAKKRAS